MIRLCQILTGSGKTIPGPARDWARSSGGLAFLRYMGLQEPSI